MPGTMEKRVAPTGAHLNARTRQSDRLTPEEIAAARLGQQMEAEPSAAPAVQAALAGLAGLGEPPAAPTPAPATVRTLAPASAHVDALVIADMAMKAGVPEVISAMLGQPMTMPQVEAKLEEARLTLQCGTLMGQPELGRKLMAGNVPLETARMLINRTVVDADEAIPTDASNTGGVPQQAAGKINSAAVYARLNKHKA